VVERALADALGLRVGDTVALDHHTFVVGGIAVSAAVPPYPYACFFFCGVAGADNVGLVWVTERDAYTLAKGGAHLTYVLNVTLRTRDAAPLVVRQLGIRTGLLTTWESVQTEDSVLAGQEQDALFIGSVLLAVLSLASLATLMGGRVVEQIRRAARLRAIGSAAGLTATVFLAENLALGLLAAGSGLVLGRLIAPLLADPGAALVGSPGLSPLGLGTAATVVGEVLCLTLLASFLPAWRATRTSIPRALEGGVAAPGRRARVSKLAANLPVALLFGLRLVSRRRQRALLNSLSVGTTAALLTAVAGYHEVARAARGSAAPNPVVARIDHVAFVLCVMLIALALVNAIFVAAATTLETRWQAALFRALGASPQQVSVGLAAGQLIPCVLGSMVGVLAGTLLLTAGKVSFSNALPPPFAVATILIATWGVLSGITVLVGREVAKRRPALVLQAERV
jgi:putative ABC transport system permease protein